MKVCTAHAITRRADGIVLIDESKCFGCRMCEKFCPYQVPQFNSLTNKVEKCTMCADRIDQDLQPACATMCPTGAWQWGDWSQLQGQGSGQVATFTDPKYTKPHIRFITNGWSAR